MPGMAILLGTTGVAFAAFCVWLVVRTINRRQKSAGIIVAAVLLALPLYPLSAPPMERLARGLGIHAALDPVARPFYAPLAWAFLRAPHPVRNCFIAYDEWWSKVL